MNIPFHCIRCLKIDLCLEYCINLHRIYASEYFVPGLQILTMMNKRRIGEKRALEEAVRETSIIGYKWKNSEQQAQGDSVQVYLYLVVDWIG